MITVDKARLMTTTLHVFVSSVLIDKVVSLALWHVSTPSNQGNILVLLLGEWPGCQVINHSCFPFNETKLMMTCITIILSIQIIITFEKVNILEMFMAQSCSRLGLFTWLCFNPFTRPVHSCTISTPWGALHRYHIRHWLNNHDANLVHMPGTHFFC